MKSDKKRLVHESENGDVFRCKGNCCITIRLFNIYWKISLKRFPLFKEYIERLNISSSRNEVNGRILIAMEDDTMNVSLDINEFCELFEILEKTEIELKRIELENIFNIKIMEKID
ncbi:MAG: DUF6686 family protein [Cyanobacteriota bacterium]